MHILISQRPRIMRSVLVGLITTLGGCSTQSGLETHASGGELVGASGLAATYYLPMQLIALDVDRGVTPSSRGAMEDRFTVIVLPPVPDTRRRFYVPANRGDEYTIRTTDAGLLASPSAGGHSPLGQQLGSAVVSKPSGSDSAAQSRDCGGAAGMSLVSPTQVQPFATRVIFDPTVPAELARAQAELCSLGARYRFVLIQLGKPSPRVITSFSDGLDPARRIVDDDTSAQPVYRGLVYRRPEPYLFAVYKEEEGARDLRFIDAVRVSLPNLAPIEAVDRSDLYVRRTDAATFQNGMLVSRSGPPGPKHRGIRIQFESGSEKKRAESNTATPAHATPTTAP